MDTNISSNQALLDHLQKIGRDLATIEQIVMLAESIQAQEVIVCCQNYVTSTLSAIPGS